MKALIALLLTLSLTAHGESNILLRYNHPQEVAELELCSSGTVIKYVITSPLVNTISDPAIPLFQITYGTWRLQPDKILIVELKDQKPIRFTKEGDRYSHGDHTWLKVKELMFDQKLSELKEGKVPNQNEAIDRPWKSK